MAQPDIRSSSRPFSEALAFHRGRASMSPAAFYALVGEARTRAFTISGGLRESAIFEAHQLLERAIATNMTKAEFGAMFGELLDKQDGVVLSPQRMNLIYQNAWATSYSVGRYRKLSSPALMKLRPIRQYPKGPHDARTSSICLKLEGFMWRAGDPVEKHIWPPNHHNERHVDVVSLTEEQAKAEGGEIYESAGAREYPTINGQEILPDPGWDAAPHLMAADDGELVRQAEKLGETVLPAKSAADYGLARLAELPREAIAEAPAFTQPLASMTPEGYAAARAEFREVFGIPDGLTGTWIVDYAGDAVRVTDFTFDHTMGLDKGPKDQRDHADRAMYFRYFRAAIEAPTEVWLVRMDSGRLVKRYITVFRGVDEKTPSTIVHLERSPEGWLMRTGHMQRERGLEVKRNGVLVMSKAPRKAGARSLASRGRAFRSGAARGIPAGPRDECTKTRAFDLCGAEDSGRPAGRAEENDPNLMKFKAGSGAVRAEVRG